MTNRERLLRAMQCEPVDRVPIRLWGVDPFHAPPRPTYQVLIDLVNEFDMEVMLNWDPAIPWPQGWFCTGTDQISVRTEDHESHHVGFRESHTILTTPAGDLRQVTLYSPEGHPGYVSKPLLQSVEDCEKWLSIPDEPLQPDISRYFERDAEIGDRGLPMTGIWEPFYSVNALMGSEFWALASVDHRELLHEMVAVMFRRVERFLEQVFAAGVKAPIGYVGPELCIPPLASPRDFDDFVTRYDQPLIELAHSEGVLVWVHCHGNMDPVLERFADMGVDSLNPIEPPPVGITLADAKRRVGGRVSFDGNVESGEFDFATPPRIAQLVEQAVAEGGPDGLILTPTSDHSHWPVLRESVIANYRAFVEAARRYGQCG